MSDIIFANRIRMTEIKGSIKSTLPSSKTLKTIKNITSLLLEKLQ